MTKTLSETQAEFQQVRDYFMENSRGRFNPIFTINNSGNGSKGEHVLPNTMSYYGADIGGYDFFTNTKDRLFPAVRTAADPTVDFSQYDHLMIYHAGQGQETSDEPFDIWSVYFPQTQTTSEKTFPGFTTAAERQAGNYSSLGVVCHEYGHQIGLPDLYDAATGEGTMGAWDLMNDPWTSNGSNPPHLGAWSKKFLGFVTEILSDSGGSYTLEPAENQNGTAVRVLPVGGGTNDYFLMEYRLRSSAGTYDKGIASDGLVVWHIDDNIALDPSNLTYNRVNSPSQNGTGRRGVEVVEADGLESQTDHGAGDTFIDGKVFGPPRSNMFSGAESQVLVPDISGVGGSSLSIDIRRGITTTLIGPFNVGTVVSPDDPNTKLVFPAGAVNENVRVFILAGNSLSSTVQTKISAANTAAAGRAASSARDFRAIKEDGSNYGTFNAPVTAQIPYFDADNDGIVDGTLVKEKELKLLKLSPSISRWHTAANGVIDTANKLLRADIRSFSVYNLGWVISGNLSDVITYPNPVNFSRAVRNTIKFDNLTRNTRISIYDLSGRLVRQLDPGTTENDGVSGHAEWSGKNEDGESVAAGLYFYRVADDNGDKNSGRIAVIK